MRKRKGFPGFQSLSKFSKSFQEYPRMSSALTAAAAFIEAEVEKRVAVAVSEKDAEIARLNTVIAGLNAQLATKTLLTPRALKAATDVTVAKSVDDGASSSSDESTSSKKVMRKKPRVATVWEKKIEKDDELYTFTKSGGEYYLDGEKIDTLKGAKLRDAHALLFDLSLGRTSSRMAPTNELLVRVIKKKMDKFEAGDATWEPKVDFENTVQASDELWRDVKMYKKMNGEDVGVSTGTLSVKRVGGNKEVEIVGAPSAVANLLNIKFKSLGVMQKRVSDELAKLDLQWRSPDETLSVWRVKRDGVEKSLEEMYTEYALML